MASNKLKSKTLTLFRHWMSGLILVTRSSFFTHIQRSDPNSEKCLEGQEEMREYTIFQLYIQLNTTGALITLYQLGNRSHNCPPIKNSSLFQRSTKISPALKSLLQSSFIRVTPKINWPLALHTILNKSVFLIIVNLQMRKPKFRTVKDVFKVTELVSG